MEWDFFTWIFIGFFFPLYFLKWYLFCQVIEFFIVYLLDLDIHFGTKDCRKKSSVWSHTFFSIVFFPHLDFSTFDGIQFFQILSFYPYTTDKNKITINISFLFVSFRFVPFSPHSISREECYCTFLDVPVFKSASGQSWNPEIKHLGKFCIYDPEDSAEYAINEDKRFYWNSHPTSYCMSG